MLEAVCSSYTVQNDLPRAEQVFSAFLNFFFSSLFLGGFLGVGFLPHWKV